ncbi:restriction endonuclease subunit S [Luteimonas sp. FXH3W]|uniref:Restriction endonuclease subunit S n=1 Tax=Aquilutibacter rugosus TaxID=3115820 RepID=A0ABU7UXN1_9GAMM
MSWETKPIGDVFRVVNGGTPKTGVASYWDGPHQWITPAEMGGLDRPYLSESRRSLTDEGLRVGAELVPANSIILSSRAPIGHLVINKVPMAFNQGCKGLVPKRGIHTKFAYYFLLANVPLLESLGTGATFKELSGGKLKEIEFRHPSLPEQHRIVAILDEAFAGIATAKANAEKNLQNAVDLFDKKLSQVFSGHHEGWKAKRLDEVCTITSMLVDPRQPQYVDTIHVGAGNIESKTGRLIDLRTSGEEGLISGKFPFDTTMVLYSKIRPYLEKVARPEFSGICSADMYPLAPIDGQATRDFLYWLLLSKPFTDYAIKGSARAGMPKVNRDHLFRYALELPSVVGQERISSELDTLRYEVARLESLYTRKLAALDELKQSLLQRAFSGQL